MPNQQVMDFEILLSRWCSNIKTIENILKLKIKNYQNNKKRTS